MRIIKKNIAYCKSYYKFLYEIIIIDLYPPISKKQIPTYLT